jgi:hypothetical protein
MIVVISRIFLSFITYMMKTHLRYLLSQLKHFTVAQREYNRKAKDYSAVIGNGERL